MPSLPFPLPARATGPGVPRGDVPYLWHPLGVFVALRS